MEKNKGITSEHNISNLNDIIVETYHRTILSLLYLHTPIVVIETTLTKRLFESTGQVSFRDKKKTRKKKQTLLPFQHVGCGLVDKINTFVNIVVIPERL